MITTLLLTVVANTLMYNNGILLQQLATIGTRSINNHTLFLKIPLPCTTFPIHVCLLVTSRCSRAIFPPAAFAWQLQLSKVIFDENTPPISNQHVLEFVINHLAAYKSLYIYPTNKIARMDCMVKEFERLHSKRKSTLQA